MSTSELRATGACISYGGGDVVTEVDLHLPVARVTALIGPNGSGKSTLLRAMAGLHPVRRGEVHLGPRRIATFAPRQLARELTMLAQQRPTPAGLRVSDVVGFGRHPHRGRWRAGDPDGAGAIQHALELTRLTDLADCEVDALSGGQLQRVWLAACLAQDTAILLLDEPTNHLDLRHQVELLQLIRALVDEHGVTVGVVLHDLGQAAAVADRVVLLDQGRVVAAGEPDEVMTAPRLSEVYGVDVSVERDRASGVLRIGALDGLAGLRSRGLALTA